jgi:hypothetical protein
MTVKEIAELCGVDERTVYRWAEAGDILSPGLSKKLEKAGHGVSADFTLDETLAIIGEGGGNKTLASLLADNAATKNALAAQTDRITVAKKAYTESIDTARKCIIDAADGRIPDHGKMPVRAERYMLSKGGRAYVYRSRENGRYGDIYIYNADGVFIRQGIGYTEPKATGRTIGDTVEELVAELVKKGKDVGTVGAFSVVPAVDVFVWMMELRAAKAVDALALPEQPSGTIIEFKPRKGISA